MSGRVRAAGRALTVGELREAIDGVRDDAVVGIGEWGDAKLIAAEGVSADEALLILAGHTATPVDVCSTCGCNGGCGE